jgi:hypothetical protein
MLRISGAGTALSAVRQSEMGDLSVNVRKQARDGTTKDKVAPRKSALGGQEVTGAGANPKMLVGM